MEPVKIYDDMGNVVKKENAIRSVIFIILFLIILGCIVAACIVPMYLISIGEFELVIGLPIILAGIGFLAGGIMALCVKAKIGWIFVVVAIILAISGLAFIKPKEVLDFFDFHGELKYFNDIFWSIVVICIGIGLIIRNYISKKNSVLVHGIIQEYIEIKEGVIRPVVEFYYNNQMYRVTCGSGQVKKGAEVGDNVAIVIDKSDPSSLSQYEETKIAVLGFAALFLIIGLYILLKTITKLF